MIFFSANQFLMEAVKSRLRKTSVDRKKRTCKVMSLGGLAKASIQGISKLHVINSGAHF